MFSIIAYKEKSSSPSAIEAAETSFAILKALSEYDELFTCLKYYHTKKEIKLDLANKENFIEIVSKQVLNKNRSEITKFEGETKPDINYKREKEGYSAWFKIIKDEIDIFDISIGIGFKVDGITISSFNREIRLKYDWYQSVFLNIIKAYSPFYCVVRVNHQTVNLIYNQFNITNPIGWLTYYSKELEINIPSLTNVTIEQFEQGTLIKTDDIDFLEDKESFEAYKSRLRSQLEKLKETNQGSINPTT
jgi:hypothetical protein